MSTQHNVCRIYFFLHSKTKLYKFYCILKLKQLNSLSHVYLQHKNTKLGMKCSHEYLSNHIPDVNKWIVEILRVREKKIMYERPLYFKDAKEFTNKQKINTNTNHRLFLFLQLKTNTSVLSYQNSKSVKLSLSFSRIDLWLHSAVLYY